MMESNKLILGDHLDASRVVELTTSEKDKVLSELVHVAAASPAVGDEAALLQAVREREGLLSTGIGLGIAIPHARIAQVSEFVIALGRHRAGLEFGSIDNKPVHVVVLIAGPQDAKKQYLELLAQISKRLKLQEVRDAIVGDLSAQRVVDLLMGNGAK